MGTVGTGESAPLPLWLSASRVWFNGPIGPPSLLG